MSLQKPKRIVDKDLLEKVRAMPCVACGKRGPSDPAHIKTKGSGGDDVWHNLLSLCRRCHSFQHSAGWVYFTTIYPNVKTELESKGWEVTKYGLER